MPKSEISDISSSSSQTGENDVEKMVLGDPMFYILSQFLETDDHENIATILKELVKELKEIRTALASLSPKASSSE